MKRRVSVLLAGMLAVSAVCQNAYGAESVIGDAKVLSVQEMELTEAVSVTSDYNYESNQDGENTITITGYSGSDAEVVIPSVINGKTVTRIESRTFEKCKSLKDVTIPSSITFIENFAFYECSELESIKFCQKIIENDSLSFYNCEKLNTIIISENVENIGDVVSIDGIENIVVDNKNEHYCTLDGVLYTKDMKTLGLYPRKGNRESYHIPDTVEAIGEGAFYGCTQLKTVILPHGLIEIGTAAFLGCSGLKEIGIPTGVKEIGAYAFGDCSELGSIVIPSEVVEIGTSTFAGCTRLKNITLVEGLEVINSCAFYGCSALESIKIPDTVTAIGTSAFSGCAALKSIKIPSGVKGVWYYTFRDSGLEKVIISPGVTELGWSAFAECEKLNTIVVPESVETIGVGAFSVCENLESVLILNNDVSFYNDYGTIFDKNTTVYASIGSTMEAYAKRNGLKFENSSKYLTSPVLSEISNTDSDITIMWEPVKRAEGYYVYRRTDDTEWEQIGAVEDSDVTSYTDDTATAGISYTYTVCAYTALGEFRGSYDEIGMSIRIPVVPVELTAGSDSNQITVMATSDVVDLNTVLVADQVSTSVKDLINADFVRIADYDWRSAVVYDIYLEKDGQKVQPNGEVTVSIPVPDQMDGEQCSVLYIDDAGNVLDMHAVYLDGYMVFTTNHFSHYVLVGVTTGVEVSGTITSYGTEDGAITVSLLDGDTEVESVENTESTYTFASVPSGTYTLQVSKENHVTRTYDITVSDEPVTQDVKICLLGDVTGDGKVNTRDLNRLYAHVNGTNPVSGYEFACGDVTGDGKINTRDLNRLYAHISETNLLW